MDATIVADGSQDSYTFYMIGQDDGVSDGDQWVNAQLRVVKASDSRFA